MKINVARISDTGEVDPHLERLLDRVEKRSKSKMSKRESAQEQAAHCFNLYCSEEDDDDAFARLCARGDGLVNSLTTILEESGQ